MNVACVGVALQAGSLVTLLIAQAACLLSAGLLLDRHLRPAHRIAAAVAFPCLLIGFALLTALAGTSDLADIATTLRSSYRPDRLDLLAGAPSILGISATVLVIAGCGLQAGLIPFHSISADLFDDSPAWRAGLLALTQRAMALLILTRVGTSMPGFEHTWQLILLILAAASAVTAALLVSRCESLRTLCAHAWLLHGGLVACGLAIVIAAPETAGSTSIATTHSEWSLLSPSETVVLLFLIGGAALCGVLASESFLQLPERRIEFFDDLTGLGRQNTLVAAALAIPLLTFIAVPPLPGFWGVVFLTAQAFLPGIESTDSPVLVPSLLVLLALLAIVTGMLLLAGRVAYVLSLVYFHEPLRRFSASGGMIALVGSVSIAVVLLAAGLLPQRLLEMIHLL